MVRIDEYTGDIKKEVVEFILGILVGEFNHTGIARPDLQSIPETYQTNNGNFWVATESGKVIGTIALRNYGNGIGYITRMAVAQKHRGTGLAQELLHTLIDFARIHDYQTLYLATSENMKAANKFYPKQGFTRIPSLPKDLPITTDTFFYKLELSSWSKS